MPDTDLGAQGFLGRHDAVVAALTNGTADLGATYCRIDPVHGVMGPWAGDERVRVLGVSGPIPGDTLCAGPAVASEEAEAMSLLLLGASRRIAPLIAAHDLSAGEPSYYDALETALLG